MHDVDDGGILISPLCTVARGINLSPAAFEWQTIRPSDSNSAGKSVLLEAASILLLEEAHIARERALLSSSALEDLFRRAARCTVAVKYVSQSTQQLAVSDTLCSAPTVARRAVKGFDVSVDVLISRLPRITELVQRVGRCNRSADRSNLLAANRDAFDSAARVDEAEVSALVELVRKIELRRLDRIARQLTVAWRRLIVGSRLRACAKYFALSRGQSVFRLPMTGAHTLTAPPAAA